MEHIAFLSCPASLRFLDRFRLNGGHLCWHVHVILTFEGCRVPRRAAPEAISWDRYLAMLFRSYKPSAPLCDFIENFWMYDGYESPHFQERTFPSGTFEMVFNLLDDELRIYKAEQPDCCHRFSCAIASGPYKGCSLPDTA